MKQQLMLVLVRLPGQVVLKLDLNLKSMLHHPDNNVTHLRLPPQPLPPPMVCRGLDVWGTQQQLRQFVYLLLPLRPCCQNVYS